METDPHPRRAWVQQIMGMPISVHVRGPEPGAAAVAERVGALFADLQRIDALFSTYKADSQVSRINRGELSVATADPLVREADDLCALARERTAGSFDPWLPGPDGQLRYDPSGLVKGWAVERAASHLADLVEHDFCVNAGGDVVVRGAPGAPPWRVGIERPDQPARLLTAVTVLTGAVATSGIAHRGTHIIDPRTGTPATDVRAVTVVGESLTWADVYATAAVALGPEAANWLSTLVGYDALLVGRDGTVTVTPGWPLWTVPRPPGNSGRLRGGRPVPEAVPFRDVPTRHREQRHQGA